MMYMKTWRIELPVYTANKLEAKKYTFPYSV